MLTHKRLCEVFRYDPATGLFTCISRPWYRSKINIGDIVGHGTCNRYIRISIDGERYYAHRLAWLYMTERWPSPECDHRDGNPSNNTWKNLREASRSQQLMNTKNRKSASGIKGVRWDRVRQKWIAMIMIYGRAINLGRFNDLGSAITARQRAVEKYHREFARAA